MQVRQGFLAAALSVLALPTGPAGAADLPPVGAARAAALFDAVCGKSLPRFRAAARTMEANGFTAASPFGTATVYSSAEDASFKVVDGPSGGKTCSMVFVSRDPKARLLSAFGQIAGRPFDDARAPRAATRYQGQDVLVLFEGPNRKEGKSYYAVFMVTGK
jgi:hypothetical protein